MTGTFGHLPAKDSSNQLALFPLEKKRIISTSMVKEPKNHNND
jgi:hypothetical protein